MTNPQQKHRRHRFHSASQRAIIAGGIVTIIMVIGTIGMHAIEGMPYIDAFYFMSMIATAQGSATTPITVGGKLFASIMAFISVGAAITSFGFLFGPLLGKLFHIGELKLQEELEKQEDSSKR